MFFVINIFFKLYKLYQKVGQITDDQLIKGILLFLSSLQIIRNSTEILPVKSRVI